MTTSEPLSDKALAQAWWNCLTEYQRYLWALRAGSATPADAYALFLATLPQHPISKTAAQTARECG